MTTEISGNRAKFWSDDFDMDLLKIFPEIELELGKRADIQLWTLGRPTFDRLNHPVVWNSHGAFVWSEKPKLPRDANGWVNVCGCVCDEPLIECTWLELLRDQWAHNFNFILLPRGTEFRGPGWRESFEPIMWHIRGWRQDPNIEKAYAAGRRWLHTADRLLALTTK